MNDNRITITGLFQNDADAAGAIAAARENAWEIADVRGPIPSEPILEALHPKKSRVGWFTLTGGIIGFFTGYLLALFTASRWGLIVSGKPVEALIPFFIVGFEFTILFSVLGNITGMILLMKLPVYTDIETHRPEFTGDRFGVSITCGSEAAADVKSFFTQRGATIV